MHIVKDKVRDRGGICAQVPPLAKYYLQRINSLYRNIHVHGNCSLGTCAGAVAHMKDAPAHIHPRLVITHTWYTYTHSYNTCRGVTKHAQRGWSSPRWWDAVNGACQQCSCRRSESCHTASASTAAMCICILGWLSLGKYPCGPNIQHMHAYDLCVLYYYTIHMRNRTACSSWLLQYAVMSS